MEGLPGSGVCTRRSVGVSMWGQGGCRESLDSQEIQDNFWLIVDEHLLSPRVELTSPAQEFLSVLFLGKSEVRKV